MKMKTNDCVDNLNSASPLDRVLVHNLPCQSHLKKEQVTAAIVEKKTNFVGLYINLTLLLPRILFIRPSLSYRKKEMCEVGESAL